MKLLLSVIFHTVHHETIHPSILLLDMQDIFASQNWNKAIFIYWQKEIYLVCLYTSESF